MVFEGNVIKYGDNVDTDVIIPARYLNTSDKKELASHCMEDLDKSFAGISLVIAKSFARIFYRNAINIGLAILECPEAAEAVEEGHIVEADLDKGVITDKNTGRQFKTEPFPEFIQSIIKNGGLIESIKNGSFK